MGRDRTRGVSELQLVTGYCSAVILCGSKLSSFLLVTAFILPAIAFLLIEFRFPVKNA